MKTALVAVALLAGCASTNYQGITTGSRLYDAEIAYKAGLNQGQTSACEKEGRDRYWTVLLVPSAGDSDGASPEAGKAFERCVARLAKK